MVLEAKRVGFDTTALFRATIVYRSFCCFSIRTIRRVNTNQEKFLSWMAPTLRRIGLRFNGFGKSKSPTSPVRVALG